MCQLFVAFCILVIFSAKVDLTLLLSLVSNKIYGENALRNLFSYHDKIPLEGAKTEVQCRRPPTAEP